MSIRRSKNVVTLLLLISAMFTSLAYFNIPQPVQAVPSITLNPTFAGRGSIVTVTGSGFIFANGTTLGFGAGPGSQVLCKFYSLDGQNNGGTLVASPICSITSTNNSTFSGSFVVNSTGTVPIRNPYTFVVNMTDTFTNHNHFIKAQATFTVTSINIKPPGGPFGNTISVNGTVASGDTTCSISGTSVGTSSCVMASVAAGNFTGSFVVANVAPGPYTVRVTGSPSSVFVETTFTVTFPNITLIPNKGGVGTFVSVIGSGYSFSDTTCSLSSPTSGSVLSSAACSIHTYPNGTRQPVASFTVGAVGVGIYIIRLTGSKGDFAEANFNVTTVPKIQLNPVFGPTGTTVTVTGSGFVASDNSCTISGTPVTTSACTMTAGTGTIALGQASFVVGGVASGLYLITVTGTAGGSDRGQAVFNVTVTGATLVLYPTNATNGATVTFRGTGFSATDTACTVLSFSWHTGPPLVILSNTLVVTSPTCSISGQVATGSFVVGPLATTEINWTIAIRGTPQNDIPAYAVFNVTSSVGVSPSTGTIGSVFSFSGFGYSSAATSCVGSFHPSLGSLSSTANCGVLSAHSGQVAGSFIVPGNAAPGLYVLNVGDRLGHNASATFTIGTPTAQITVSPNIVPAPGTGPAVSVSVTGSGFNANDTTCAITSISAPPLFTSSSCAISGGFVSGSFTVSPSAVPGLYLITVTGTQYHDFASNFLEVATVTTVISTTTSTATSTTATSTTTLTTSTSISSSLTTTTMTSTGPTTIVFQHGTLTTVSAVSTTTSTTVGFTASPTTATTTTFQTVTFGQIMGPSIGDELSLLGMLLLVAPILLRRLFN